jgi:hypothetical protein
MTINFALSLSFEGIELLHRVQSGWRRIGRVDFASNTFDADLTELRQKAISLAPDGVTSKLIIPADQIKFTAIDSTQTTQDDIDAKLAGATPYALDELVVDAERFGGRTHIAAVARETLREAEAFATAHGLNPVAFVAIPEPFTFQQEVFFGPTSVMPDILGANATVTRDDRPVFIAGTRLKSRLLVMDDAADFGNYGLNDLFDTATVLSLEVAAITPAATRQAIWIDAIPVEFWKELAEPSKTQPALLEPMFPDPVLPEPVLAELPLFDLVITEVYPSAAERMTPVLMAVANGSSAQAPKLGAPATVRQSQPVAPPTSKRPLTIAASIAAAVAFGALAWSQISLSDSTSPTVIAEPLTVEAPTSEIAPIIPEFAATAFGASNILGTVLPDIPPIETRETETAIPETILAGGPDAAPPAPQLPPEPSDLPDEIAPTATDIVLSPAQAELAYAETGVWQRSPRFLDMPSGAFASGFTRPATLEPPLRTALPSMPTPATLQDFSFTSPATPPSVNTTFARDENGFIEATAEGTLTPNGALVFAGLPDLNINLRPELSQDDLDRMALLAPAPKGVVIIAGRPAIVLPLRPASLSALQNEPAVPSTASALGGVGLAGLELQNSGAVALNTATLEERTVTDLRPKLRPNGLATVTDAGTPDITDILTSIAAEDASLRFDSSTTLAVQASRRPAVRPSGFSTLVATAAVPQPTAAAAAAPAAPVAAAAPVAPQNYAPVPGGVARAATQEDVISLREINLIGIYGRPNARRALVRLSNGRYVRVEVGSELDGGQVTAIGDEALNFVKRGRTYAIQLPAS